MSSYIAGVLLFLAIAWCIVQFGVMIFNWGFGLTDHKNPYVRTFAVAGMILGAGVAIWGVVSCAHGLTSM